jgi:DNA-binding IclR family transcriptional regulator
MRKQVPVNESGSVGTLARGLDILALFAQGSPELSQKEISDALGLPLPTVHRLTGVLADRGFLERDPRTKRFRLGLEVARLMPALLSGLRLPDVARPYVVSLAAETGEAVHLAMLQGSQVLYLLSESGGRLLTSQTPVGLRLPVHCTALGKALLAQLDDHSARAVAGPEPFGQRTPHTLTDWTSLRESLREVGRSGVATSEEEFEIGLVAIAVPVRWHDAPGGAAINVSLPASRATAEFREELIGRLRAAGAAIEASLGLNGMRRG